MKVGEELKVSYAMIMGHKDIRSWIQFHGVKYIGMSSCTTYDQHGNITSHIIEPTGLELYS